MGDSPSSIDYSCVSVGLAHSYHNFPPHQVLREKNWTDKVTDEMKKFEKKIIKAMRVGISIL